MARKKVILAASSTPREVATTVKARRSPITGEPKVRKSTQSITMDPEIKRAITVRGVQDGRSFSGMLEHVCRAWLQANS